MSDYKKIILKPGKESSIERFHCWVFSGAIDLFDDEIVDGETVAVYSSSEKLLGIGHFSNQGSISVRLLTFEDHLINDEFYAAKLKSARSLRQQIIDSHTNCFRLVHGEGDGLPGLIIDVYNQHIVMQAHTLGMHLHKNMIKDALLNIFPTCLTIYYKSENTLHRTDKINEWLHGTESETKVKENNIPFYVNWVTGQKTGFFIDQRDNRAHLKSVCNNKSVLNTFCYSGGFSAYALDGNASKVISVDSSQKAIELTEKNIALHKNNIKHQSHCKDVFEFLKEMEEQVDIVILDPPAFAKNISAKHQAVQAYKRLNIEGLKKVKSGGWLFTFSCSQVVDRELFYKTILSAAIESKRNIRVVKNLEQCADHPVNIFHTEGHYLKGLMLYVE